MIPSDAQEQIDALTERVKKLEWVVGQVDQPQASTDWMTPPCYGWHQFNTTPGGTRCVRCGKHCNLQLAGAK